MGLISLVAVGVIAWSLPPIRERVEQRARTTWAEVYQWLYPPEKEVFLPAAGITRVAPTAAVTIRVSATMVNSATPGPPEFTPKPLTSTPIPPSPTITPTPPPASVILTGAIHEYQQWNNCGPATLAMALSYWKWQGDQRDTRQVLRPNEQDKNTAPEEMLAYVTEQTDLRALLRVGGTLEILKRLIAAGFPVLIEQGHDGYSGEGWMGHYRLLTGYRDGPAKFTSQDSLIMADFPVPYDELEREWRAFNNLFIVVYPAEREAEVLATLGPWADEQWSVQFALERASEEAQTLTRREQFFATFNRGSNLVLQNDMAGAAAAYDEAFTLNASLTEEERPWRMMWYQLGPYQAYFAQQRYEDVIRLADYAVSRTSEPALEESFYWRGKAKAASGDTEGAIQDFRMSAYQHPNYPPAVAELQSLGVNP